jgi:DNA-binding transcriptional MerR regulator
MPETTRPELAVPDRRAAKLAQISMRQLHYWDQTGLVVPSIKRQVSQRNVVRLYSFQDLLTLLVAAQLRNRVSLQHIRRVVAQLNQRGFAEPVRELHFATYGPDVYFQYPDGSWSGDPGPDQVIFHQVIELETLRAKIPTVTERDPAAAGRLVRRRGVMGSKPVFAETRIPVEMVRRYLDAGYDADAIISEYPSLAPADVEAARHYAA